MGNFLLKHRTRKQFMEFWLLILDNSFDHLNSFVQSRTSDDGRNSNEFYTPFYLLDYPFESILHNDRSIYSYSVHL